ncbi:MAG: winged helix-turn-helix domain-containing protein [Actinobacteria bacterium]|nr:winged helix-turn-helix domain-containing protein [Actinomycetota bacterium]MBU2687280.1 winged helix-turn-helix domain-containing protein [Actinomycetota bacterium]
MRVAGSAEVLEYRRRRALDLLDEGRSLHEVAGLVDCAPSSVMRWRDARDSEGEEGLKVKKASGRPPRLTDKQKSKLEKILLKGSIASGYRTDLWTTARIAEVIERNFGVSYHRDHIGRILRQMGWSHQKPERRAAQRDEKKIREWVEKDWPRVKKTPAGWAPISSS